MSNLLDRLRGSSIPDPLLVEAADVLDYLEAQVRLLEDALATARAEITQNAVPAAVPDGYVLVPKEPTFDMRCAFRKADAEATDRTLGPAFTLAYAAMLAAAQKKEEGR